MEAARAVPDGIGMSSKQQAAVWLTPHGTAAMARYLRDRVAALIAPTLPAHLARSLRVDDLGAEFAADVRGTIVRHRSLPNSVNGTVLDVLETHARRVATRLLEAAQHAKRLSRGGLPDVTSLVKLERGRSDSGSSRGKPHCTDMDGVLNRINPTFFRHVNKLYGFV